MAGRGPAPKAQRYRRADPARGDWKPSPEGGWQHELPTPPLGLRESSIAVWNVWFRSWWAGNWTPDDLPGLRLVIRLYDRVQRGDVRRLGELRQLMDSYGITPKGQQDRRWQRPAPPKPLSQMTYLERIRAQNAAGRGSHYDHLRTGDPLDALRTAGDRTSTLGVLEAESPRESAKERLKRIEAEAARRADPRLTYTPE